MILQPGIWVPQGCGHLLVGGKRGDEKPSPVPAFFPLLMVTSERGCRHQIQVSLLKLLLPLTDTLTCTESLFI